MAVREVLSGAVFLAFGAVYATVTLPRTAYRLASGYYGRLPGARLRRAAKRALSQHPSIERDQVRLRVNEWSWADPESRAYSVRHRMPPTSAAIWLEVDTEEAAEYVAPQLPAFGQALRSELLLLGIEPQDAALVRIGCVTSAEIQRSGGHFGFDRELWTVTPAGRLDWSAAALPEQST